MLGLLQLPPASRVQVPSTRRRMALLPAAQLRPLDRVLQRNPLRRQRLPDRSQYRALRLAVNALVPARHLGRPQSVERASLARRLVLLAEQG